MTPLTQLVTIGLDSNLFPSYVNHIISFDTQQEAIQDLKNRRKFGLSWPALIIAAGGIDQPAYDEVLGYLQGLDTEISLVVMDHKFTRERCLQAKDLGAFDYLDISTNAKDLDFRIQTILRLQVRKNVTKEKANPYKISITKRIFDIAVSSLLLLLLSPLFLVVALLIRLESPGKVFYYQPRVGSGYRIFKFFKFRSMRPDADKMVKSLKAKNQYADSNPENFQEVESKANLIGDSGWIGEGRHQYQVEKDKNTFFKVKNDPRITKVGKFIRNTSIDELPQLFNVLIGDMSIVGNRPLPLYEAEQLTTDNWSKRFLAPAGITGLWQVTERGKANASDESRKRLDIQYAEKHTFWGDMEILFKTPLAALQNENV